MITLHRHPRCRPAVGCCGLCVFAFSAWVILILRCPTGDAQEAARTMHTLTGGYSTIVARGTTENAEGMDVEKQMLIKFTGDLTLVKEGRVIGDVNAIGLVGYTFANDDPFRPFASAAIESGKLVLELEEGRNIFLQATKRLDAPSAMQPCQRSKLRASIELPRKDEKFIQQVGKEHIVVSFGPSGFAAAVAGDHRNYTLDNKTKRPVTLVVVRDRKGKFWGTEDLTGDRVTFDAAGRAEDGILERHRIPNLSVSTEVSFAFQEFGDILGRKTPISPNTWHIQAELANVGAKPIEFIPVYFFWEGVKIKDKTVENGRLICPLTYKEALSKQLNFDITVAPPELKGKVKDAVLMPLAQLDEPVVRGRMGAYYSVREFKASLSCDGAAVPWKKLTLRPKCKLTCIWQFSSPWASPAGIRTAPEFRMGHIGPVILDSSQQTPKAFVPVTQLEVLPSSGGTSWKQASVEVRELPTDSTGESLDESSIGLAFASFLKCWRESIFALSETRKD